MKRKIRAGNWAGVFSAYRVLMLCLLLLPSFSAAGAADIAQVREEVKISIQRGTGRIAVYSVEIVSDRKALQKGLSDRAFMPDDHGMLFVLDSGAEHSFWMKGMKFPIDILFFNEDRNLTAILPKLTPCKECPTYKAPDNTAFALELNAGVAEAMGFRTGDRFVYENK
jgi:uncharacterized membrane protein (UPF0127 family)